MADKVWLHGMWGRHKKLGHGCLLAATSGAASLQVMRRLHSQAIPSSEWYYMVLGRRRLTLLDAAVARAARSWRQPPSHHLLLPLLPHPRATHRHTTSPAGSTGAASRSS
jgi:hypothetical protein